MLMDKLGQSKRNMFNPKVDSTNKFKFKNII